MFFSNQVLKKEKNSTDSALLKVNNDILLTVDFGASTISIISS